MSKSKSFLYNTVSTKEVMKATVIHQDSGDLFIKNINPDIYLNGLYHRLNDNEDFTILDLLEAAYRAGETNGKNYAKNKFRELLGLD